MKKLLSTLGLVLLLASVAWAADVTKAVECSAPNDEVRIITTAQARVLIHLGSAVSGVTVITPEASLDGVSWAAVPIYRATDAEVSSVASLTSSNTQLARFWAFDNPGYNEFRLRVSTFGNPGSVVFSLTTSPVGDRPIQLVSARHPNAFSCTMSSTATVRTLITGCSGAISGGLTPFGGLSLYITGLQWSSSIISTVSNNMLFTTGSGVNCGSGTTDVWQAFHAPAFAPGPSQTFSQAIKLPQGFSMCFQHSGNGTRKINVQGFVAP